MSYGKPNNSTNSASQQLNDSLLKNLVNAKSEYEKFDTYKQLINLHQSNIEEYTIYLPKAWAIAKQLKNDSLIAELHLTEGSLQLKTQDYKSGIEHLQKALNLYEKAKDSLVLAQINFRIAGFYFWKENLDFSIKYMAKSLATYPSNGSLKQKATYLMSYGVVLQNRDLKESIKYHEEALKIKRDLNLLDEIPISLNNLAELKIDLKDTVAGLELLNESIILSKQTNQIAAEVYAKFVKGQILFYQNNYKNAVPLIADATLWWEKQNSTNDLPRAYKLLAQAYKNAGLNKEAIITYEKLISIKDSLFKKDELLAIQELETKYETEKKEIEIAKQTHEKELAIKENKLSEKSKQLQLIVFSIIALLLITNALYFFNRYKKQKRDKDIIATQKILLETKNKEVEDSINYAKRIQNAILPPLKDVQKQLPNSFVFYKPKDIVAGDFYWMEHRDNTILFAVADCTGHGVPGAMVSMVCNYGLNRSVREYGLSDPGKILDKTREIVVEEFEKSEEEVKDGMDIALCSLTFNVQGLKLKQTSNLKPETAAILHYAGAHNPLWLIREGQLIEIKANKQPIGQFDNPEPYTTHSIELQKDNSIYIFSDGYADQFGGEKGKKFKTANLKELLVSFYKEPMDKQKQLLEDTFENWKGDIEQLDDVCIIGVKI